MILTARTVALLAALLALGVSLAGCSVSTGTTSNEEQLEKIITNQLPGKLQNQVDKPVVKSVNCTKKTGENYSCAVNLRYEKNGESHVTALPIDGRCDDKKCYWETRN